MLDLLTRPTAASSSEKGGASHQSSRRVRSVVASMTRREDEARALVELALSHGAESRGTGDDALILHALIVSSLDPQP